MSLDHIGIGGIAILVFLSVGLGLVIHPIQFGIVQFFEGYWGTMAVPQAIRSQRILRYQRLCRKLNKDRVNAKKELDGLAAHPMVDVVRARLISRRAEADRLRSKFPRLTDDVMPTRLGNVLRRAESQAGSQYGINALQAVPHLLLVAPANHIDYVNDQRTQLDLAVRMAFISAAASATAVLFLWPYGFWALIAAIPYALAYLSYRGSVIAGSHYGSALDTLINLDRFALYEQLHLPLPPDTISERSTNEKMTKLFNYDNAEIIAYNHPSRDSETRNSETKATSV